MEFKNKQRANCGHKRISGKKKRLHLYISYAPTTRLAPVPFWLKAFLVPTCSLRLRTWRILRVKALQRAVYDKETQNTVQPFFCFRSNFRAITRLETLATQANEPCNRLISKHAKSRTHGLLANSRITHLALTLAQFVFYSSATHANQRWVGLGTGLVIGRQIFHHKGPFFAFFLLFFFFFNYLFCVVLFHI